jgi:hypothetical protein
MPTVTAHHILKNILMAEEYTHVSAFKVLSRISRYFFSVFSLVLLNYDILYIGKGIQIQWPIWYFLKAWSA